MLSRWTEKWKATETQPERLDSRTRSYSFSPLVGWTLVWKFRLRTSVRGTWERRYVDNMGANLELATTQTTNWSINMTNSYQLRTSRGIRKFWGRGTWRLDGDIDLALDASYGRSRSVESARTSSSPARIWKRLIPCNGRSSLERRISSARRSQAVPRSRSAPIVIFSTSGQLTHVHCP